MLNTSKINRHSFVCSKHFVNGKPSPEYPNPASAVPDGRGNAVRCRPPPTKRVRCALQGVSTDITGEMATESLVEDTTTKESTTVTEMGRRSDDPLSPDYVPSWFAHTTVVEKERSMAAIRRYRRYEGGRLRKDVASRTLSYGQGRMDAPALPPPGPGKDRHLYSRFPSLCQDYVKRSLAEGRTSSTNSEASTCELSATLIAKPKKKEKDCKPTEENPYLKTWLRHNYHPLQKQKRAERSHSGPMSQHFTHWNTFHPTRLHEDYCLPESVQWAKGVWKKGSCGDSESQSQPQAPDPIIKAKGKWEWLGVDLKGPLPMTHEGHRFMLTVMDYYSKWVEACPMRSDSAGEVALKVRNLVCQLGLPRALLSQMDTKFIVAVNEALGIYMAVEDCSLLAFHPDACSLDTVTHSRVNSMVSELVRDHQEHWDLHLPSALFALRLRRHPDTSHSAFYALYRREPRKDSSPIAARELPLGLGEDHPIRKVLASRPHVDTQDRHPSRSNVDETLQDQTDVDIVLVVQCERCSLWDRVTQGSVAERGGSPLKQDEDDAYTCAACRAVTERPGEEQGEEDRKDRIPRLHVDDSLQAKQEPETWRGHDTRGTRPCERRIPGRGTLDFSGCFF
ncbi:hypothetical protein AAFF_G00336630 [Aldrovandia affinis]|uniref:Integrase catalytic domain-containing protein n=1 Tax=Aldrovandia affinis TaxID=143900 RepID=A0AAD7R6F3_9TELE|nr:hypothetical protein AAFF_G00336630 [Aldrovandia affinis]